MSVGPEARQPRRGGGPPDDPAAAREGAGELGRRLAARPVGATHLLGARPVRGHLVHALVELDRATSGAGSWEDAYAAGLLERFGSG